MARLATVSKARLRAAAREVTDEAFDLLHIVGHCGEETKCAGPAAPGVLDLRLFLLRMVEQCGDEATAARTVSLEAAWAVATLSGDCERTDVAFDRLRIVGQSGEGERIVGHDDGARPPPFSFQSLAPWEPAR